MLDIKQKGCSPKFKQKEVWVIDESIKLLQYKPVLIKKARKEKKVYCYLGH